jgi:hypothetical protein
MPRLLSLDLARGFTVLFIPTVHCVMLYSTPAVHQSSLGFVLSFIAEWPGAQVFMFLMGMSFSFSMKPVKHHVKKAVVLLLLGYLLNALKFLVPLWLGVFPESLVQDLHFYHGRPLALNLFLIGDIFHFAAIALLIMALLKRSTYWMVWALAIVFILTVTGPLLWDLHHSYFLVDHFLHLVGGRPDDCFFPLVPWIIYPLVGMLIGSYFQLPYASVQPLFFSGCFLFIASALLRHTPFHFPDASFFRAFPDMTNMHLGFVIIWICIWFWASAALSLTGPVAGVEPQRPRGSQGSAKGFGNYSKNCVQGAVRLLCFCSRNISLIYLVQWPVVCWLLPVVGYRCLSLGQTLAAIGLVNGVVFGFVHFVVRKRIQSDKCSSTFGIAPKVEQKV